MGLLYRGITEGSGMSRKYTMFLREYEKISVNKLLL